MKETKAYLFDFDGTLVDTMEGFADIAGEIINKYHPEIEFQKGRRMYLDTSGVPFFQQLEIMFKGNSTNKEKAKIFEERKKEGFFKSRFSDEVKNSLNELRSRGYIVGVSSNNFQELIDEFVADDDLEFDIVLGFKDGFEKGKDHFDYIKEKLSLSTEKIIFVGDSLKDAERAINNGIEFIGLCNIFSKKDFLNIDSNIRVIKSIKELLSL